MKNEAQDIRYQAYGRHKKDYICQKCSKEFKSYYKKKYCSKCLPVAKKQASAVVNEVYKELELAHKNRRNVVKYYWDQWLKGKV